MSGIDQPSADRADWRRSALGAILLVLIIAAAARAVWMQRAEVGRSVENLSTAALSLSLLLAIAGTLAMYLAWRTIVAGLGGRPPHAVAARTFFLSQLGKYVPGSVWPAVIQMEAARRFGLARRTMLTANLFTIALGCAAGLVVAGVTLPFAGPETARRYWWAVFLVIPLVVAMSPRALPWAMNRFSRLLGRPPIDDRLSWESTTRSGALAMLSFILVGAHLAVVAGSLNGWSWRTIPLCAGIMALAICLGVLAVPVPAGAGIRDGIIVLGLATFMPTADAILAAVSSRALLLAADVLLALVVLPLARTPRASSRTSDTQPG